MQQYMVQIIKNLKEKGYRQLNRKVTMYTAEQTAMPYILLL